MTRLAQFFATIDHPPAATSGEKPLNLSDLLGNIGEEGDFNSKMRESLVSIGRMVAFQTALLDQTRQTKEVKDLRARVRILQRDIQSLTDHSTFLSGKIGFMLDAVLGLSAIEQNDIIKIFTVASMVFLPPTLVASLYGMNFKFMPELHWKYGYVLAIGLMILSAAAALALFQAQGLALMPTVFWVAAGGADWCSRALRCQCLSGRTAWERISLAHTHRQCAWLFRHGRAG